MRRSVPRLVGDVHVASPNVDEMVPGDVVERHILRTTVQLVLMESNKVSVIDKVVHRQPLLQDIPEVLLWVLRPKQGGINDL